MTCIVIANVARKKTCPKDPFVCSKKGMIYPIQSYDRKGWDIGPSILRILRLDELNKTNLQSDSHFFSFWEGVDGSLTVTYISIGNGKKPGTTKAWPDMSVFHRNSCGFSKPRSNSSEQTDFVENSPEDTRPFFGAEKCRPQNSGPCRETIEGFFSWLAARLVLALID